MECGGGEGRQTWHCDWPGGAEMTSKSRPNSRSRSSSVIYNIEQKQQKQHNLHIFQQTWYLAPLLHNQNTRVTNINPGLRITPLHLLTRDQNRPAQVPPRNVKSKGCTSSDMYEPLLPNMLHNTTRANRLRTYNPQIKSTKRPLRSPRPTTKSTPISPS